jgi:hypothetical protein
MAIIASMPAARDDSAALDLAHRMRMLMGEDLDEYDMADKARAMALTGEQLTQVWPVLTSTERSAWKQLLELERPNAPDRY